PSAWDVPLPPDYGQGVGPAGSDQFTSRTSDPTNAPPRIDNFNAESLGGGMYNFTGTVVDEMTIGMYVRFSGVPSMEGVTAQVGPGGMFSLTVSIRTDGSDNGTVSAVTYDNVGQK